MEEEIRKEFMELLRLLDEGKLQEFKDKATECPPVDIAEGLEEIEDEGRVLGSANDVSTSCPRISPPTCFPT